jgi:carboxyl-terminal processing protease
LLASALSIAFLTPALQAASLPADKLDQLLARARECEQKGHWTEACAYYDQVLKTDHTQPEARERYPVCLQRAQQLRRHRDSGFIKSVAGRRLPEALDVYEEVLARLQANYVERDSIQVGDLFRRGLLELRYALEDEAFLQEQLSSVSPARVRAFTDQLDQWPGKGVRKIGDAREQVRAVALAGLDALGLNPASAVMEFAYGACNGLDEYTLLLTPAQFSYLQASLRGELVGVGIKVALVEQKLVITSVVPNSPAGEKGLRPNDRITRVDGQPTDSWSEETASARLMGKVGTTLDLEVFSGDEPMPHAVRLVRQAINVPSVEWEPMPRDGIGYIHILTFQDTTVQELKDAILQLQSAQMKVLILDLRGNPGGAFRSAVQVAEMFLSEGIIVCTDSPVKKLRSTYRAHNPSALTLPLVVLIDGETASAAEVVAGGLKENERATLVGAPTFGKGTIQCPVPLDSIPAGIWLTVAKFCSPSNQPYTGRGVTPHILAEVDVMGAQRAAAWRAAQQLAMMR